MQYRLICGEMNIFHNNVLIYVSPIITDRDGFQVYSIPNIIQPNAGREFRENIIDAVTSIRKGYGDRLEQILSGAYQNYVVLRYINRLQGDAIRKRVVSQFEHTNFGYKLQFTRAGGGAYAEYVGSNNILISVTEHGKPLFFDTYSEAVTRKASIVERYKKMLLEYHKLKLIGDTNSLTRLLWERYSSDSTVVCMVRADIDNVKWDLSIVQAMEDYDEDYGEDNE